MMEVGCDTSHNLPMVKCGSCHTLLPSVYGVCDITANGEVSYPGVTFIWICSGKHDK